ncbi:MAG TPA: hypothetical protein VMB85_12755 [Bryobacteraceae bacterium]|jgi:hypothetical protein|nr:hypothetical protein [Bryobacteraceae bacterium]
MFDSLDEQIKKDDERVMSGKERAVRYTLYVIAAIVIFGGLVLGVHLAGN